jgi:endonuclease G
MPNVRSLSRLFVLSFAFVALAQDSLKLGDPGCDVTLNDREPANRKYFQLCHSSDLRIPLWVGYVLTKADLDGPAERPAGFKEDKALKKRGAKDTDYVGSGFSRGHMAPAEDFSRSKDAMKSTFILSNVVPQYQRVNGGRWAQLELMVRNLTRTAGRAYVFTGPLFEEEDVETMVDTEVGIPTHTFKVILTVDSGETMKMYAVIMPNADGVTGTVNSFATTVRAVEEKTGFDFFSALSRADQNRLEQRTELLPAESLRKKSKPARNRRIVAATQAPR